MLANWDLMEIKSINLTRKFLSGRTRDLQPRTERGQPLTCSGVENKQET